MNEIYYWDTETMPLASTEEKKVSNELSRVLNYKAIEKTLEFTFGVSKPEIVVCGSVVRRDEDVLSNKKYQELIDNAKSFMNGGRMLMVQMKANVHFTI